MLGQKPLNAVLAQVALLASQIVPGADEVSVTVIERGKPRTMAFAGPLSVALDERQYQDGFGPCVDAARTGQTIMIEDTARDVRYPGFSRQAHRAGIHHTLSLALSSAPNMTAALNIYGSGPPGPFDQDAHDIATTVAGYATVAILNAVTYDSAVLQVQQMKVAMGSRAGIEQAKGILMGQHRCTPEEAFALLVRLSSTSNRKVRDVAQALIDAAAPDPGPAPDLDSTVR